MPGYDGNPDSASEAALEHVDNLINASQKMLAGPILSHCKECGEEINPKRVEAARANGMTCQYCIDCQEMHDKIPKIKMLDHIL
jgi:RNA polymerase-binding transcription factor DksA